MTDQEKLQQLFNAALRDSTPIKGAPKQAVPQSQAARPIEEEPEAKPQEEGTPTLNKSEAEELGKLLDERVRRKRRRRRIETLVTAVVLIGTTSGFAGWFVSSPTRLQALATAVAEVRSVGDIRALVASYQKSLDKIAARGQQIDEMTKSMGVSDIHREEKDASMDAEMKQMMGGEGKTSGDRAKGMQQAFGKMREKQDQPAQDGGTLQ